MKKEKKEKGKKLKNKGKGIWAEFKAFISKGSVLDLAVGVVIGGAFSAIVTATVNILLSVCTWAVPGGIKGLVTVLPALNDTQKGMDALNGLGQKFAAGQLQSLATTQANLTYGSDVVAENPNLIESMKTTILSKYTLHGTDYVYNMSSTIDWGTLINAAISFIIIAIVLFAIVKIVNTLKQKKAEFDAKMLEEYYTKHPEERPAPVDPAKPEPTTNELLTQIRDALVANKTEAKE